MPDRRRPEATTGPKYTLADFRAYAPGHMCIYMPCKEPWPNASVECALAAATDARRNRNAGAQRQGQMIMIAASRWLEQNQSVEQMTWAPGLPELIEGPAGGRWRLDRSARANLP